MLAATQKPSVRVGGQKYVTNNRRFVSAVRVAETDAPSPSSKPKFPDVNKEQAVAVLKAAAKDPGSVKPSTVLTSIIGLEKLKLKPEGDEYLKAITNKTWRLIYTAGSKDVVAFEKGEKTRGGQYVPIAAANIYREDEMTFENGIFLGPVAYLTFKGPWGITGKQGQFDVDTLYLGLGPLRLPFTLKKVDKVADMSPEDKKKLPFFLYAYVDDDIIAARGRSGGMALWARADTEWAMKAGVLQVYKQV